ncbi:MAG: peptidylprolyl isomerase [bacterium]|nr:peptidylprolyl isomerase [bacterium]
MSKSMSIAGVVVLLLVVGGILIARSSASKQADTAPNPQVTDTLAGNGISTQPITAPAEPEKKPEPVLTPNKNAMHTVTLETSKGTVVFETYDADAPKTVDNFITLAKKGFYDNLIFHRVIKGFMIQGGDPDGTGTGGPGYKFEDELNPATDSYKAGYKKGVVAMANAGPNTNGSQFFIMLADYPLPNSYSIFGKVIKGQDVVDAIGVVATGANDKPVEKVEIKKATVQEVK